MGQRVGHAENFPGRRDVGKGVGEGTSVVFEELGEGSKGWNPGALKGRGVPDPISQGSVGRASSFPRVK